MNEENNVVSLFPSEEPRGNSQEILKQLEYLTELFQNSASDGTVSLEVDGAPSETINPDVMAVVFSDGEKFWTQGLHKFNASEMLTMVQYLYSLMEDD